MKKALIPVMAAVLLIMTTLPSCGAAVAHTKTNRMSAEADDRYGEEADIDWDYIELEDGTACICGYRTDDVPETVKVPSTIDGLTVSEVEKLFKGEKTVKKVILPKGLVRIGADAFRDSVSIEEVELRSAVMYVYPGAFCGCRALKSLSFPEGLKRIEISGISENGNLKELHVPVPREMVRSDLAPAVSLAEGAVIYAPKGSVWEGFASEMGYGFIPE